jgi:hypothetical protein
MLELKHTQRIATERERRKVDEIRTEDIYVYGNLIRVKKGLAKKRKKFISLWDGPYIFVKHYDNDTIEYQEPNGTIKTTKLRKVKRFTPVTVNPQEIICDNKMDEKVDEVKAEVADVAPLGKKLIQSHSVVLEASGYVLDAKGHLTRLHRNAELSKELTEIRVGDFVEDNKSGVDWDLSSLLHDSHCVAVASWTILRLKEGDVGVLPQSPGAGETRDTRAHHGDAWSRAMECPTGRGCFHEWFCCHPDRRSRERV